MSLGVALAALFPLASAGADLDPEDVASWALPRADLYDVEIRGDRAWAVGYWGTVLRSQDGGRSWSPQATPTRENLYAVSFGDGLHGWAVGAGGVVLRSADGGSSWRRQPVAVTDELGGRRIWEAPLFDVAAVSEREAWAVGDFGMVLHTVNGTDWEPVAIPAEAFADENLPDRILNAVDFADRERGWIGGEFGTTLRTADGGRSWVGERTIAGAAEDVYLMALAGDGSGRAVAAGVGGVVLRTSDAGASWRTADLPTHAGLFGVALDGERVLVVGDRGVIYGSRDGGATWFESAYSGPFRWLRAAALGADGLALLVGEAGLVLRSTDGGESWQPSAALAAPPASEGGVREPPATRNPTGGRAQ